MRTTSGGRDGGLIAELNDLIQLDHDAVEAYTVAVDSVRDAKHRETLVEFRADHKRHIEELGALVRERGGLPVELPHPTGALKIAVQAVGAAAGDVTLMLAFKAVEGQVRDKYRRFANRIGHPPDVAEAIRSAAADEDRHYAWVEQTLRDLGVGPGSLPHGLASVVETVHKVLADPLERAEREVMRAVGSVVGTTRSRGGREAPSPADAAAGTADAATRAADRAMADSMQAAVVDSSGTGAAPGDAIRFMAALRALEENRDVEGIAALFDADAEVSNPTDAEPHRGRDGARRFWETYRGTFDEIRSDFSRVVTQGDTAMLEWTSRGRTTGGTTVEYSGVSVLDLRDGKVRRFRAYFDAGRLGDQVRGAARGD
jgi:ketosteroid isomerase-like protein/rubrerythrin